MTDSEAPAVPLTCFAHGERACIQHLGLEAEEAERLRDMGLREGTCVCVMMNTDKCILGVTESRIALQREVAMRLLATPRAAR